MNIHMADGSYLTYYAFCPYNYDANVPDEFTSVTVETPETDTVYTLVWDSVWNEFSATISGQQPEMGVHVFTATTIDCQVISSDYQYVVQSITNPDKNSFSPAEGAVVAAKTPIFSWDPVELEGVPLYYRFEVVDTVTGQRVWASSRNLGMTSITLKNGMLTPGGSYKWRVRVTDSNDWVTVQNRANSDWVHFSLADDLEGHDALPAIHPNNWNGLTWTGGNAFAASVKVVDLDGVACDGSSHSLTITAPEGINFPDGSHVKTMDFDSSAGPTTANYGAYVGGGTPESGEYTFTVTDPEGNQTRLVEQVDVAPLPSPNPTTLIPSNIDHYLTATVDNVTVCWKRGRPTVTVY